MVSSLTNILHIETATKVCSVAISQSGILKAQRTIADDQYAHGEQLTILIQAVSEEAGIPLPQLSAVSMSHGPGSYTGLRIGMATAKGICFAFSIPLILIDSLTVLAELARNKYPNATICSAIDARRMEIYATLFDRKGLILKEMSSDVITETSYSEFEPFVCVGDGAGKLTEIWEGRNITIDSSIVACASGQVRIAHEAFESKRFADIAYSEPIYLKDFGGGALKKS